MLVSLREIADLVGGEVVGDENIMITGVSGIKEAKEGDITFVANARYTPLIGSTQASAIIVSSDVQNGQRPLIRTPDPYLAFTQVMSHWLNGNGVHTPQEGIHPTAVIGRGVKIGRGVWIRAYVVIDNDVEIGDRVVLHPHVTVGHHSKIGDESIIYSQVSIREKVTIGKRCIFHSGTVIGSDGFGFAPVKGVHHKVPQIGKVIIEDDVEVGANCTVDRATIGETRIGKGTKIDNLVQIAHNVVIGENSIIVAQVGISGSAVLGKGVTVAGQAGVVGHVTVGDNTVIAARAGVTKPLPPNSMVSGFPAKPHEKERRIKATLQRLPELARTLSRLGKRVDALEGKKQETD